jgi:hypothetical protein
MKKIMFALAILIFASAYLKAQMNTGSKFVAGYNNLSFNASSDKYVGTTSDPEKYFDIGLTTKAGYFLKNRLAIGGLVNYNYSKATFAADSKNISSGWSIGPLARYYLQYASIIPFAELSTEFGMTNNKQIFTSTTTESKHTVFGLNVGIGADYFLNESIAFEGMLGYSFDRVKPGGDATGDGYKTNGFGCSFGIVFYFGTI